MATKSVKREWLMEESRKPLFWGVEGSGRFRELLPGGIHYLSEAETRLSAGREGNEQGVCNSSSRSC